MQIISAKKIDWNWFFNEYIGIVYNILLKYMSKMRSRFNDKCKNLAANKQDNQNPVVVL